MINASTMIDLIPQDPITEFQLPVKASTFAASHDGLFAFTFWICVFFFFLILGVLLYSIIKYRRRSEDQPPASYVTHNTALEVTWTVIPLILVMIIFAWGFKGYVATAKAPVDARPYQVDAKQWSWRFKHPGNNGSLDWTDREFYVEVNKPVLMVMRSQDVLHSFFIPAFRIKRDVLPGRMQTVTFTPTMIDSFDVFCTEYCGNAHSSMLGKVHVVSAEEFAKAPWAILPDEPEERGEIFYTNKCAVCHTNDGTPSTGPTFKGLFGKEEILSDGTKVIVDEAYIKESIRNPGAKIVKGFETENMTMFSEEELPDDYINDIIIHLKTLK